MPYPANSPSEQARVSDAARRALTGLTRDCDAECIAREAFVGSGQAVSDRGLIAGAVNNEQGHAEDCSRLAAAVAEWKAEP